VENAILRFFRRPNVFDFKSGGLRWSRPVRTARRSKKAGDPNGRPIVSAPRTAAIAWVAAGMEEIDRQLDQMGI